MPLSPPPQALREIWLWKMKDKHAESFTCAKHMAWPEYVVYVHVYYIRSDLWYSLENFHVCVQLEEADSNNGLQLNMGSECVQKGAQQLMQHLLFFVINSVH